MLILTRRIGESIILLGESVEPSKITILEVNGLQVRVGIDAPKEVNIVREELLKEPRELFKGTKGALEAL